MLPAEHHGKGFYYVVTYRRRASAAAATSVAVPDWRRSDYVVEGQLMYDEYDISVLARNEVGDAPSPTRMIGYSGEDSPCLTSCFTTHTHTSVSLPHAQWRRNRGFRRFNEPEPPSSWGPE